MATASIDAPAHAVPVERRIEALDVVRGAALFGILLVNITQFGLPQSYLNPQNSGGATGANLWAWIVLQVGFEGTQRALFSMLFGASVILLTSRLEASGRPDAADIYFRRNLWLIGLGMVNAFLFLWWGDILYTYGVIALFVFVFRKLAPKTLFAIGIGALLIGAVWNLHDAARTIARHEAAIAARAAGDDATPEQRTAIARWEGERAGFKATPESIARSTRDFTTGWWPAFQRVIRINVVFQTWYLYRYFFDAFGMMLIGMALFRTGVLTLERPARLYWFMLAGGYAVGLTVNILETRWIMASGYTAVSFAQAGVSYDLGRLAMTIGHLGALLLFVRSGALGWLRRALAAVGQMAVTNYLTHSIVCGVFFIGFGWFNQLERHQLYALVVAIWAFQLALSPWWLKRFHFGPVEWIWRWVTYLERPPLRRAAG